MENVVLAIHLILALLLIGLVLLQRSEGGGLGMGGGGGGGVVSGRTAATALAKVTWVLAGLFIATSITLTILAASTSATSSVIDQIGGALPEPEAPAATAPLQALPAADAPATPPAAEN
ncbi:preprotein translocase subunit SecG [Rhodobacter sp. KR11]|uniref:preprotein translocase subunit SecG n=1 Tax=Rhodobacter sp. KR11 TaxID=2974588 RepID=UPI0022218C41|nr:preprotein translocase subunit SecG [Rhodobacter sp. KR11]MCW1917456.1 preprotein translocase subunit SecG [Rhodobacter sp. KR11]